MGWYSDEALTQNYDFTTAVTSDLTLYAKWEKGCVVTFVTGKESVSVATQTVKSNATATEPQKPACNGYTFVGWYSDEALTQEYDFTMTVTSDLTLYAKWEVAPSGNATVGSGTNKDPYVLTESGKISGTTGSGGIPIYYSYSSSGTTTLTIAVDENDMNSSLVVNVDGGANIYVDAYLKTPTQVINLTAGQTVVIQAWYYDDSGTAAQGTFNFTIEIVVGSGTNKDPYVLTESRKISGTTGSGGIPIYYSYSSSGTTTLTIAVDENDMNSSLVVNVDGGANIYVDAYLKTPTQVINLTAGQTVVIQAWYYDDSGTAAQGTFNFTIEVVVGSGI